MQDHFREGNLHVWDYYDISHSSDHYEEIDHSYDYYRHFLLKIPLSLKTKTEKLRADYRD